MSGKVLGAIIGGLVLMIVVLGAVLFLVAGEDDGDGTTWKGGRLAAPVSFLRVTSSTPGACSGAGTPSLDGRNCYRLGTGLTVRSLKSVSVVYPPELAEWRLRITLDAADQPAWTELTRQLAAAEFGTPQRRLAIVVNGKVISAPEVHEPLTSAVVDISGAFSRTQVEDLARQITGAS